MTHYLDITLLSAPEFKTTDIRGLMSILHGIQSKIRDEGGKINLAVDFPEMSQTPTTATFGNTVRLFGDRQSLITYVTNDNISNMENCCQIDIGVIRAVPDNITAHVKVRRDQRITRFRGGKKGATLPELMPCAICLNSKSSSKRFELHITRDKADEPLQGGYSTYGLSTFGSTIPCF